MRQLLFFSLSGSTFVFQVCANVHMWFDGGSLNFEPRVHQPLMKTRDVCGCARVRTWLVYSLRGAPTPRAPLAAPCIYIGRSFPRVRGVGVSASHTIRLLLPPWAVWVIMCMSVDGTSTTLFGIIFAVPHGQRLCHAHIDAFGPYLRHSL